MRNFCRTGYISADNLNRRSQVPSNGCGEYCFKLSGVNLLCEAGLAPPVMDLVSNLLGSISPLRQASHLVVAWFLSDARCGCHVLFNGHQCQYIQCTF